MLLMLLLHFGLGEGRKALSEEDSDALLTVLPQTEVFDAEFDYYLHVAALFKDAGAISYEVFFTQLALSVAPAVDTLPLWTIVIKGFIELCLYDDAYGAIMSSPYEKL